LSLRADRVRLLVNRQTEEAVADKECAENVRKEVCIHKKFLNHTEPFCMFKEPYWPFCMFEPNIFSFLHDTLLAIISQRIKPYFSFPDILQNLLIFQNQIFK
ncbi:hypothetical protein LDENG_00185200, partial [Lucifuga dentata]